MNTLIETENLFFNYNLNGNQYEVLKNINLKFPEKGYFGILGPSGSGKSSLLYLLSGLRIPTQGKILYCEKPLPSQKQLRNNLRKQEMGFVFQSSFLIDYLNIRENIMLGSNKLKFFNKNDDQIEKLAKFLEIDDLLNRQANQLSGGQKQRVTIARAILNNPKVLFVDEPTSNLDHKSGQKVVDLLKEIAKKNLVIIVTHDETNLFGADYVYSLWDGEIQTTCSL